MEQNNKTVITIKVDINSPVDKVWKCWTTPADIVNWNFASPEWHTPWATNDLRVGGKLVARMEAKDGSAGFDFEGIYDMVVPLKQLEYSLGDTRKVKVIFTENGNHTTVEESFDAENMNSLEMQRAGWQAILDNFKKYTESKI